MADTTKVAIGACQVTYGDTDLGHTLDGVELSIEREFQDLTVDQYGSTPVNKALTGQKVMAKFKLAEVTIANLAKALPEGTLTGSTRDTFGTDAGYLLGQNAALLRLRPLKNVAGNSAADDVLIYKAVSTETLQLNYKVDEQRVIEITMEGLVDTSQSSGRLLGEFGTVS